ncbi:MAG: DUF4296 domain-containing protein [Salibacteraceae bacterium]
MNRSSLLVFVSVFLFALTSCSNGDNRVKPEGLIQHEQMVDILYHMGLSEAAYRGRLHTDTLAQEKVKQRVNYNFNEHGVTKKEFEESYDYYMKEPDELVHIYNDVLALYSTKLSEVEESVD